jgi:dUTP pyrophosphatase
LTPPHFKQKTGTMPALRLFIAPTSPKMEQLYHTAADKYNTTPPAERNSGFDLHTDTTDVATLRDRTYLVSQGCRALALGPDGQTHAFWLAPRSSISKTKWRLANSLGLIDATYRGVIRAALDSTDGSGVGPAEEGARLCQLAAGDLAPWAEVIVVAELPGPATQRGEGGIGSTGRY